MSDIILYFYTVDKVDVIEDLEHIIDTCLGWYARYPSRIVAPSNFPYYSLIYRGVPIYQHEGTATREGIYEATICL